MGQVNRISGAVDSNRSKPLYYSTSRENIDPFLSIRLPWYCVILEVKGHI